MSFKEKAAEVMGTVAVKVSNQKYIMAIKKAFVVLMPVIITGAFAVLVSNMIMSPENGLAHFKMFAFLAEYQPIMKSVQYATLNFLTIGAVFLIGIELGRINGNQTLFPGILALISFISVIPTTVELMVNGKPELVTDVLAKQFSDPKSLWE